MQFAFRWMNCLLMRELSMPCVVRMWDTYLVRPDLNLPIFTPLTDPRLLFVQTEGTEAFSQFHLYVCSAFLVKWSAELREMDFQARLAPPRPSLCPGSDLARLFTLPQEIIMFLQNLPTQDWTDAEVRMLLSEAYVLMSVWVGTDAHFTGAVGGGGGMGGR